MSSINTTAVIITSNFEITTETFMQFNNLTTYVDLAENHDLKGFVLNGFLAIFMIFLVIGIIFIINCIFIVCSYLKCAKKDSVCLFFNRDLKDFDEKINPVKYELPTLSKLNENLDQSLKNNNTRLNKDTFYGLDENSDSAENLNQIQSAQNIPNLGSFKANRQAPIKLENEPDDFDIYASFINLTDSINILLNDPLDEIEKIEQRLSKSLMEIDKIKNEVCSEVMNSNSSLNQEVPSVCKKESLRANSKETHRKIDFNLKANTET